jgi:hypothetical protein
MNQAQGRGTGAPVEVRVDNRQKRCSANASTD